MHTNSPANQRRARVRALRNTVIRAAQARADIHYEENLEFCAHEFEFYSEDGVFLAFVQVPMYTDTAADWLRAAETLSITVE